MFRTKIIALSALVFLTTIAVAEKPNILFIFADDQSYETIRAHGYTDIDTPNLDRLVESGTSFSHAYNMGSWSGAVCVASRHMLNTGAFVWKAEQIAGNIKQESLPNPEWPDFQAENLMWSQLMKSGGYSTYFTGKWHVKADAEAIFDVAHHVRPGMPSQTPTGYNRPVQGQPDPWSPFDKSFGGFWEGGKHWSEIVADDAIEYIGMEEETEDPFFMYVAFNAPHDPRQAPKEYIDRYPLDRIEVPENFLAEYPFKDQIDNSARLRDEKLAPFPRTKFAVQVHRQEYYAIITHMDEQIGRVLDALEASGKAENTYVFYSADHGLSVGHHGLIGKQNLFDHSVRVPLIITGPGVAKGKTENAPVYLQDIMRTSLELGEVEVPAHVQFDSLLPIMNGDADGYDAIYGAYLKSQRSVVKDGFKLVLYPKVPKVLLFDLESDPLEMKNVAKRNPEKTLALFRELQVLQKETGDQLDLSESFPELSTAQ
tara:strand:- start:659 stop:2110 length:1452 start_codon:yes stop_codon:yes gene_type:complete